MIPAGLVGTCRQAEFMAGQRLFVRGRLSGLRVGEGRVGIHMSCDRNDKFSSAKAKLQVSDVVFA
jgi:hypothetical protein